MSTRAIVKKNFKLVINLLDTDELYDMSKDPGELRNLINIENYKEIRDELHQTLLQNLNKNRDPFRGYCWERRPWSNSRKIQWKGGEYRAKLDDGYSPLALMYTTGRPPNYK